MKQAVIILTVIIAIIFVYVNWEWISQLRNENLSYFTDELFAEFGYAILFITIPLMMLQNVITLFPIIILIMFHFISFGIIPGFIYSFIGTTLGALLCFWLTRSLSERWINRFWGKRRKKLTKILNLISSYGVLTIVLLRSIPVMPSNLISIAAAISPIQNRPYFWSTIFGNISMVWLLSILSSPLWMEDNHYLIYFLGYLSFAAAVVGYYIVRFIQGKGKIKF